MDEHRDFMIHARRVRIPDDQGPERAVVGPALHYLVVVVERPPPDGFPRYPEPVGPATARMYVVTARAVLSLHAERPRAVGVDPIAQPVHVQAVAVAHVRVADVDGDGIAHIG